MGDIWRQQLEAEIDEAEQTINSIKCKRDILLEQGARIPVARLDNIYKELLQGALSPEQEEKLLRESVELHEDPLYIELGSYDQPLLNAVKKLNIAKSDLEYVLAKEARSIAPPATLPSGSAESKFPSLCCSNFAVAGTFCAAYGRYIIKLYVRLCSAFAGGTPSGSVSGAEQLWRRLTGFWGLGVHNVHHHEKLKSI